MSESDPFKPREPEPLLIVLSGPSGVGKDSVLQCMQQRDLPIHFVITATTRPPRPEEVHGEDYYFYTKEQFDEMIARGELLEYALVYNDYKGIPRAEVDKALASGKDVVLRVDVQGAASIHSLYKDALLIFLTTETEEELVNRLKRRKSETPEGLALRIATARQELQRINEFDYVVPNPDSCLDETVDVIYAIIRAEHYRVNPRKVSP